LPINQEHSLEINVKGEDPGWQKIVVSAENEFIEKRSSVEYAILDNPAIELRIDSPDTIEYGQELIIAVNINKTSFNPPRDVIVLISLPGREQKWEIEQINTEENIKSILLAEGISFNNKVDVTITWKDQNDKLYSQKQELKIKGSANGLLDNTKLLFNGLINWFL